MSVGDPHLERATFFLAKKGMDTRGGHSERATIFFDGDNILDGLAVREVL
jgi:hypothetical protein